jgi:tetratricopeptide (TPR) repeat protein
MLLRLDLRTCLLALYLAAAGPCAGVVHLLSQEREIPAPAAWEALERGDAATAAGLFREALDRSPRNPLLHFGAGYAAHLLGRTEAAIASLKRAIEYNPRFVQAMLMLATVAYASADLDLAIRTLEKAAAIAPNDGRIRQQLEQWRGESAVHERLDERPGIRFRVLYDGSADKAVGDRVSTVLERVYWDIGRALNTYPSETLTVVLYTKRQFRDITRAPAWAGGGYDGRIRLPAGGALRSPAALDRVLTHEFVHYAVATAAPRGVPTWVNEGLASWLEGSDRAWVQRALRAASELIPLDDLDGGFGGMDSGTALVAYAESHVAGQLLCEKLGPSVGTFLQMLGSGHTVDQALSTHGVQPDVFRAEWKRRVSSGR